MTRISIVTICFNNPEDVKSTCDSVDLQDQRPFEHIIIDGSTGQDIRLLMQQAPQPGFRCSFHEPDKGISDAFNKGISNCHGDVILLLNAGDRLYDNHTLAHVAQVFNTDPALMWCHGAMELMRGGQKVIIGKPFERRKLYRGMRSTFHPTMYLKASLYRKHGNYDTSLKMAMDYDMLCRIADEKCRFIDVPLARFEPHGISTNRYMDALKESYRCYRKYFGFSLMQEVWLLRQWLLHVLLESKAGPWLYNMKRKLAKNI